MKFTTILALIATASALTLRKVNPNGADVTLNGDKRPPPPPPVASSEAHPYDGSPVDASKEGTAQHNDAITA